MRNGQPVNWVEVAIELTRYINDTGALEFDGPLDVLDHIDALEAADNGG